MCDDVLKVIELSPKVELVPTYQMAIEGCDPKDCEVTFRGRTIHEERTHRYNGVGAARLR